MSHYGLIYLKSRATGLKWCKQWCQRSQNCCWREASKHIDSMLATLTYCLTVKNSWNNVLNYKPNKNSAVLAFVFSCKYMNYFVCIWLVWIFIVLLWQTAAAEIKFQTHAAVFWETIMSDMNTGRLYKLVKIARAVTGRSLDSLLINTCNVRCRTS